MTAPKMNQMQWNPDTKRTKELLLEESNIERLLEYDTLHWCIPVNTNY
jgi:tmRNA-binding protein